MRTALQTKPIIMGPLSPAARALVRRAQASPDKTVFLRMRCDDAHAQEAEAAGYLAPLTGHDDIWRITATGEAYLAALMRAH